MPITIVIGGQYGSEGKGKVAYHLAHNMSASAVVRVGGPNSGHTIVTSDGQRWIFRQLPTSSLLTSIYSLIPAGSYLDSGLLKKEIEQCGLSSNHLAVDPHAFIITETDKKKEKASSLNERIGSTLSGTGSAVARRIERSKNATFAQDESILKPYIKSTKPLFERLLREKRRIIIEGTQGMGFGLPQALLTVDQAAAWHS